MKFLFKPFLYLLAILPCFVFGDAGDEVGADLSNFFNTAGFTSNITNPSAYQGQEAGYYSGGGAYLQSSSRYIQPIGITAPSINAGCGGIDIFSGGMSFINSQYLTQFAQSVMSNASGYALHLALATWAPQINEVLQYIQDEAQQINQYGMSSCQAAEDLVGGVWDMAGQSMTQACQAMGDDQNQFQGWVESAEGCKNNPNSVMNQGQAQGTDPTDLQPNTNFAWQALTTDGIVSQDPVLAQFLMTISGTIVLASINPTTQQPQPYFYPAEYANGTIINALINGGTASIYACDTTTQCLNITQQNMTISQADSLLQLSQNDITELWDAMQSDNAPLPANLQAFLSQINLPVMTILESTAMSGQDPGAIINTLSQYLAYYLLNQYLQWVLGTVNTSASSLNISPKVMSQFTTNITAGEAYLQTDLSTKEQEFANILNGMLANDQMMQQVMGKATTQQLQNLEFESGE